MTNQSQMDPAPVAEVAARLVWSLSAVLLVLGMAVGYFFPGQGSPISPATVDAKTLSRPFVPGTMGNAHPPTPEEMRQMADQQALPLLEQLRTDPNNAALLMQVGAIYNITRQFSQAAIYYGKAVQADPKDVAARVKFASSLYRQGDVDAALAQLSQAVDREPKDVNSLFNLGMIRLQGKGNAQGALTAWQQLLRSNPQLDEQRKAVVLQWMGQARQELAHPHRGGGVHHDSQP